MSAQNILKISVLAAAMGLVSSGAFAGDSATQDVGYGVSAINEIAIDSDLSDTISLTVATATAGSQPDAVTQSSDYDITTNGTDKKISAAINTAMPDDVTLSLTATAPTGGTSAGKLGLTATAQDVVSGITKVAETGIALQYELSALVTAGTVESASKTVTLTIIDG